MHRIDGPGHVGGAFVSEDLALGRPPTVVTPEWLNAVQSELIAAIGIRGGEQPNKGDNGQLARAILAAMGNLSGLAANPPSGPLTASHAGRLTSVDLTTRPAVQLSSATDIPVGAAFGICGGSGVGTFTITPPSGGYISFGSFHPGVNVPITMRNDDVIVLVRASELSYSVVSGGHSASPAMASSLGLNGWQRLPSGLIVQWVAGISFASSGAATSVTSLPIAFPNARLATIVGLLNNGAATESPVVLRTAGTTLSQTTVYCANAVASSTGYSYITVGY